jgi:mono/diheme cytochrome c family protein
VSARALCLLALIVASGCEREVQGMYDQPRAEQLRPSALFEDGGSARAPPADTVPYSDGVIADASSGRSRDALQESVAAAEAQTSPYPQTLALMQRGRGRFEIYCAPCHGSVGDGDGWIARRGFPHPPSYHDDRLRSAPDRYLYDVITNGHGVMLPYANRVTPADRWAIVAYIRALQYSQDRPVSDVPPDAAARLQAEAR